MSPYRIVLVPLVTLRELQCAKVLQGPLKAALAKENGNPKVPKRLWFQRQVHHPIKHFTWFAGLRHEVMESPQHWGMFMFQTDRLHDGFISPADVTSGSRDRPNQHSTKFLMWSIDEHELIMYQN